MSSKTTASRSSRRPRSRRTSTERRISSASTDVARWSDQRRLPAGSSSTPTTGSSIPGSSSQLILEAPTSSARWSPSSPSTCTRTRPRRWSRLRVPARPAHLPEHGRGRVPERPDRARTTRPRTTTATTARSSTRRSSRAARGARAVTLRGQLLQGHEPEADAAAAAGAVPGHPHLGLVRRRASRRPRAIGATAVKYPKPPGEERGRPREARSTRACASASSRARRRTRRGASRTSASPRTARARSRTSWR